MSPAIAFEPKHAQPFTLEQAMQLEIDMLVGEIGRLENSLEHLRRTQMELISYLDNDPHGDEDGEIGKAVKENEDVIASQEERITLIKVALLNKVGEGGMRHYGLAPNSGLATDISDPPPPTSTTSHSSPTVNPIPTYPPSASSSNQDPPPPGADIGLYL